LVVELKQADTSLMVTVEQQDEDGNIVGTDVGTLEAMSETYCFPSMKEVDFNNVHVDSGTDLVQTKEEAFKIANSFKAGKVGEWPWEPVYTAYRKSAEGFKVEISIVFTNEISNEVGIFLRQDKSKSRGIF
jgi:hypothetical protein